MIAWNWSKENVYFQDYPGKAFRMVVSLYNEAEREGGKPESARKLLLRKTVVSTWSHKIQIFPHFVPVKDHA